MRSRNFFAFLLLLVVLAGCDLSDPVIPKKRVLTEADYHYLNAHRIRDPDSTKAQRLLDQRDYSQAQVQEARKNRREREAEKVKKMTPEQKKRYEAANQRKANSL